MASCDSDDPTQQLLGGTPAHTREGRRGKGEVRYDIIMMVAWFE